MPLTTPRPLAVSTPAIVWLGTPESTDPATVGRMSANLSILSAGERVPPGFVISAAALRAIPPGEPLPDELRAEIAAAYHALAAYGDGRSPEVTVRASFVDERSAPFGGQNRAQVNIVGADAVIAAVEACRPAEAHLRRGRGKRQGYAVLVQQMVRADVSAVVFSANPLNGDSGEVLINATWGLGESLSDAAVAPDTWVIERASGLARERHVGAKLRMRVADFEGVREEDVPGALRLLPTLTTRQVRELVGLATSLEARMGGPVNIECAYRGGDLYLLACRPLTMLATPALAA